MSDARYFDDDDGFPRPFGRYQLLSRLGQGGMGEVFLAKQPQLQGIERYCVIKRVRPGRGRTADDVARFFDEARVVVQLNHRNICRVFDVGEDAGDLYLAMDLIAGRDLREIREDVAARGGRVPLNLGLLIAKELLVALDYAHRLKHPATGEPLHLVHRDVSPHNVMVSYEGEVALIDFGLAASALKEHQTAQGEAMGKIAYMAPEQLRGTGADTRTDVYAAGIMLFELASGRDYFEGLSPDELLSSLLLNEIPKPNWSVVPEPLLPVVQRAVAEDPAERFPSCTELLLEVERFERSEGLSATAQDLRAFMDALYPDGPAELRAIVARYSEFSQPNLAAPGIDDTVEGAPVTTTTAEDAAQVVDTDPTVLADDTQRVQTAELTELEPHKQPTRIQTPPAAPQTPPSRARLFVALAIAVPLLLSLVVVAVGLQRKADPTPPPEELVPASGGVDGTPEAPGPKEALPVEDAPAEPDDPPAAGEDDGAEPAGTADAAAPAEDLSSAKAVDPEQKKERRRRRSRVHRPRPAKEPAPELRTTVDKIRFLKSCKRPCAGSVRTRARGLADMSQRDARQLFDDLDRCVRACGG